jgi:hypothetical protein
MARTAKDNPMPVSPEEVEAYVFSDDNVDRVIATIDKCLSSSDEKNYRYGGGESGDDYYYSFAIAATLSQAEMEQLRKVYVEAGWAAVQVRNAGKDNGEPGMLQVRIFRMDNSRYLAWPAK